MDTPPITAPPPPFAGGTGSTAVVSMPDSGMELANQLPSNCMAARLSRNSWLVTASEVFSASSGKAPSAYSRRISAMPSTQLAGTSPLSAGRAAYSSGVAQASTAHSAR